MKKFILTITLCFIVFVLCCSCSNRNVISSIAYNQNKNSDNLIYLLEDGEYVPFIVLTNDYNDKSLLLRKEILEHPRQYNEYSSLYENSHIDRYLNEEYLPKLNANSYVIETEISVTEDSAIGTVGDEVKVISRKVFLLSSTEIDVDSIGIFNQEGKPLKYFKNGQNRIAYHMGQPMSWWLRTPNTYYLSSVFAVGSDGKIGDTNAYDLNGVRPAFCVPNSLKIELREDIFEDKSVYVISKEH